MELVPMTVMQTVMHSVSVLFCNVRRGWLCACLVTLLVVEDKEQRIDVQLFKHVWVLKQGKRLVGKTGMCRICISWHICLGSF